MKVKSFIYGVMGLSLYSFAVVANNDARTHFSLDPGCGCHGATQLPNGLTFASIVQGGTTLIANTPYRIRLTRPPTPLSAKTAYRIFITNPGGQSIGTLFQADGTTPVPTNSNTATLRTSGTNIAVTDATSAGFTGGSVEYVWVSPNTPAALPSSVTIQALMLDANNDGGQGGGDRHSTMALTITNPNNGVNPPPTTDPLTSANSPKSNEGETTQGFNSDFEGGCGALSTTNQHAEGALWAMLALAFSLVIAARRRIR